MTDPSIEQTRIALEGYDQWVKRQLEPDLAGDRLSVQSYLAWYAAERMVNQLGQIAELATSDIWDEELGKEVRKILGTQQGKPRLVEAEE